MSTGHALSLLPISAILKNGRRDVKISYRHKRIIPSLSSLNAPIIAASTTLTWRMRRSFYPSPLLLNLGVAST